MDSDLPRLTIGDGGTQVQYQGKNLYSPDGPIASSRRRARSVHIPPESIVVVPSPLLGYGLQELLSRLPDSSHILCVEVDERLMSLTLDHVHPELLRHRALSFVRADSPESVSSFLHARLSVGRYRRVVLAPISGGYSLHSETYRSLVRAIERDIKVHWQNRLTGTFMGRLWIRNLFRNLPFLAQMNDISTIQTELPIVVAGAGESLEFSMPWLLRHRKDLFLLSTDTAAAALVAEGITPDFIVTVEAQWANLQDFVPIRSTSLSLAGDLSGAPAPYRLYAGCMHTFFLSEFASVSLIRRMRQATLLGTCIPPLGSVGVIAVYLARKIGSNTIFLTGLDFSYRLGKTHARGTPNHIAALRSMSRLSPNTMFELTAGRESIPLSKLSAGADTKGYVTDTVLRSYAENLANLVRRDPRFFVLGSLGIDLGLSRIKDESAFVGQIKKNKGEHGTDRAMQLEYRNDKPIASASAIRSFLNNELAILSRAAASVSSFLNNTTTPAPDEVWLSLAKEMEEVDYVYLDFPDAFDGPKNNRSFLKRFLANLYGYRKTIEQLLVNPPL